MSRHEAPPPDPSFAVMDRRGWMGLLARAGADRVAALFPAARWPEAKLLRPPQTGTVMVQGRIGATGGAFHLGEITVTRCSLQLETGEVGHSNVQGRNRDHARAAALVDALLQTAEAEALMREVIMPLAQEESARRTARAAKAAATKVDFFTMVRGEDA